MPVPEHERIIHKFLELLIQESEQEESDILPSSAWENLESLLETLEQSAEDNPKTIALLLLKWCKSHQYFTLLDALQPTKDPTNHILPRDPNLPLTNHYVRSVIRTAQKNQAKSKEEKSKNRD